MTWFKCLGNNGGGVVNLKWNKTELFSGGTSSDSSITLSDDYHNFTALEFLCENASSGKKTSLITTPEILDSVFQYSTYVCLNEYNNNQYCCFSKTSNTVLAKYSSSRNLFVKSVNGLFCNGTVTKSMLYERQAYSTGAVTITGSNLLDYDYMFFATCTGDNTETIVSAAPFQNQLKGSNNSFVATKYDGVVPFEISNTEISSSNNWFAVHGLKVRGVV